MKTNRLYFLAAISFLLFITGTIYNRYFSKENLFKYHVNLAEKTVEDFQNEFNNLAKDTATLNNIIDNNVSNSLIKKLNSKPFFSYLYKNDELLFWSSSQTTPNINYKKLNGTGLFFENKNGFYIGIKHEYKGYQLIALQLVKTNYKIVNSYLTNGFSPYYSFDNKTEVLFPYDESGTPITDQYESVIFKVKNNSQTLHEFNSIDFIGYASLLFFLLFSLAIIRVLSSKKGFTISFISLLFLLFIFNVLIFAVNYSFKKNLFFSPEIYASPYQGQSLGALVTYTLTIFIVVSYFTFYYHIKKYKLSRFGLVILSFSTLLMLFNYIFLVKGLVLNSVISFDVSNLAFGNPFMYAGFFVLLSNGAAMLMSLNAWIHEVLKKGKKIFLFLFIGGLILLIIGLISLKTSLFIIVTYPLIIVLLVTGTFLILQSQQFKNSFNQVVLNVFFLSLTLTGILSFFNQVDNDLQKANLATKFSEKRDMLTEYKFGTIKDELIDDPYLIRFFTSPFVSKKELSQRLDYLFFSGYLSKYNIVSYAFNPEGKPIKTNDTTSLSYFQNLIKTNTEGTSSEDFYLLPKSDGQNTYISILSFYEDNVNKGYLVLEFTPKIYTRENLYPELLLEEKINLVSLYKNNQNYDYAVYKNNYLITQSGKFAFPYFFGSFNRNSNKENPKIINRDGFRLNIFDIDENTIVVISTPLDTYIKPLSYFSYILVVLSLFSLLMYIVIFCSNYLLEFMPKKPIRITLKNKINITISLITLSSFFLIAVVTVGFFSESYKTNYKESLIRKQKSVLSSILYLNEQFKLDSYKNLSTNFNNEIASLAKIQSVDINMFDTNGKLLVSSQPGIFNNGLISKYISPEALFNLQILNAERYMQEESIGSLKYQSIYVPIRTKDGVTIAYLNIPYFAQVKAIQKELNDLTITLTNLYILLLIISVVVTYLISNSVTSPLAKISEDLKRVSLSKKNKEIQWQNDDEIGALVKEYNKMLIEIERSAKALAKSERESAWREMARQIAHEIKNPLTPMKLSVQHLQRAITNNDERVPELTQKVSNTIIQQIDNLSDIATAFSNFAKMPMADKKKINLIEKIDGVVQLFKEEDKGIISFKPEFNEAFIFADNNQILSVFNNLIKNALQATEDVDDPLVQVFIEEKDDNFVVSILDNGCGISEEKKDKVFVPNFTTKSSGTGLGLAISKQIVENSNGKIWFKSKENLGTTFFVSLPKIYN